MNSPTNPPLDQLENRSLGTQFTEFEVRGRAEFDENGWSLFTEKIIEYQNDLYTGSRRECIARIENELTPVYSGKDVERASMRLDFTRLYARKREKNLAQLGVMAASLLTGVFGNWAFSDIAGAHPSMLPWCLLIVAAVATVGSYHLQTVREIEP
jgi:hypothetical protein